MATLASLGFEMERRIIVFKPTTTMPDETQLTFNADPNTASSSASPTSGEFLIYHSPISTRFAQLDGSNNVKQEWWKQGTPNTWEMMGVNSDTSIGNIIQRLNTIDGSITIMDASIIDLYGKYDDIEASLGDYVRKDGDTMSGDLTVPGIDLTNDLSVGGNTNIIGNLSVGGNLTVDGSVTAIDTTHLDISTNFIKLNTGLEGTPPDWLQSGIVVERGDEDPYVFVFDESKDTFRIGVATLDGSSFADASTQAVATREDTPDDHGIAVWNKTFARFDTSIGLTFDANGLYIDGSLRVSQLSSSEGRYITADSSGNLVSKQLPSYLLEASIGTSLVFDSSGFLQVDPSLVSLPVYDTSLLDTIKMPIAVGGFEEGTLVSDLKGDTLIKMWDELLFPTVEPNYIAPDNSFGYNIDVLQEIGDLINITFTSEFDKGSININTTWQNDRSGDASLYDYTDPSSGNLLVDTLTSADTNVQTINGYLVVMGEQPFTNIIHYLEGPQPQDNKETDFGSPLGVGQTSSKSLKIEGVYPLYATTSNISVYSPQSLNSMSSDSVQIDMVPETGGEKQKFSIPNAWTGAPTLNPIIGIETLNTNSNKWEYTGGTAASSLLLWDVSNGINRTIQGNSVSYDNYVYNGTDRSSINIRLIF